MEAMIDTAVHIGIPRDMARIMVANTVKVPIPHVQLAFISSLWDILVAG